MKRTVIKLGGAVLGTDLDPFWEQIKQLQQESEVILVHGGGPQTTALARRLGHEPTIVHGRRVTTELDLNILTWVISGQLNTELVAQAGSHGIPSVGLSGADAGLVTVEKRPTWKVDGSAIDFGHVGDFLSSNTTPILALLQAGLLPILSPPGVDAAGKLYNINADTVALELSTALHADTLIMVTGSGGVLDADGNEIRRLKKGSIVTGQKEGWIQGGMKVKTDIGMEALNRGISNVWITAPDQVCERRAGTQLLNPTEQ